MRWEKLDERAPKDGRVEQVGTMSGFWVSGGGSAPGNLAEMEWRRRYLEITEQRSQSVGWIDHRGHCKPMAIGSVCKGSGQEGGVGGQKVLGRIGAWLASFCPAPFSGRTWPPWAMLCLSS